MISPEVWFTLYALARKGAVHKASIVTTKELGESLQVSQQTASRRIALCVKQGYVARTHTANGMLAQLTAMGLNALEQVYDDLESAFAPPEAEISIRGYVMPGIGEGAYYVDIYSSKLEEALGFTPYPGTLNIKVDDDSRRAVGKMKQNPPLVVDGFVLEGRTFGDVVCYRVVVNGSVNAAVVIAQRTHHSQDVLEILAPVDLRKKLKLEDNSPVTLTVRPLHYRQ